MNQVLLFRNELATNNYIRKADPLQRYWFDFAAAKMAVYRQKHGESFALIIAGDAGVSDDYYAIPYGVVAHAISDQFLSEDEGGLRRRWVGSIDNGFLKITRFPERIDVRRYRAMPLLALKEFVNGPPADYEGHTREAFMSARVDQCVFRQRVLENFDYACAISGVLEQDLLVASHIVPWSVRSDIRTSPANGLLLCVEYDALFDKGYISFDDELSVVISEKISLLSQPVQSVLNSLRGKRIRKSMRVTPDQHLLRWHRENKLGNHSLV